MINFDEKINRFGTHSVKWAELKKQGWPSSEEAIAMWIADTDFKAPPCVQRALGSMLEHGVYGYYGAEDSYLEAVCWWMKTQHDWVVNPRHILATNGLVNAIGVAVQAYSAPGDGVVIMTPVYHAFASVIRAANRRLVECPLARVNGRYEMDFDAWSAQMTGQEKMLILCSPHNPGGRVWSVDELRATADFCQRHDLIVISDEIHHDIVMPGHRHHVLAELCPELSERLVTLTAASKTFNIAGAHVGNAIIADKKLHARFENSMMASGVSTGSFGKIMAEAAYSLEGQEWLAEMLAYLDENRRLFDKEINALPGVVSMPLEATYLAWVDFTNTGLEPAEVEQRIRSQAKIYASRGGGFGLGGEPFMRFNFGTDRARLREAIGRLQQAFADLQ